MTAPADDTSPSPPDDRAPPTGEEPVPRVSALLRRLAVTLVVLAGLGVVLTALVGEPIAAAGEEFVARFGLAGLFFGVLVLDAIPGTVHEPLMVLGYEGGLSYGAVVVTSGTASVLSGILGWAFGRLVGRTPFVRRALDRHAITAFMTRYGGWAVALAAFTPFPFAITTWGAGATGVRLPVLVAGSLLRFPKELLYFGIYVYGASLVA